MIVLNKITTKTGDKGSTSLGDGSRVSKASSHVVACGDVDELNASLGFLLALIEQEKSAHLQSIKKMIVAIQHDLFDIGADLCRPVEKNPKKEPLRITDISVQRLEHCTQQLNKNLTPLRSFVLPGGSTVVSGLHVVRTVARRAERSVVHLQEKNPHTTNPLAMIYLNRLSDVLFVMARSVAAQNNGDVLWEPGKNRL